VPLCQQQQQGQCRAPAWPSSLGSHHRPCRVHTLVSEALAVARFRCFYSILPPVSAVQSVAPALLYSSPWLLRSRCLYLPRLCTFYSIFSSVCFSSPFHLRSHSFRCFSSVAAGCSSDGGWGVLFLLWACTCCKECFVLQLVWNIFVFFEAKSATSY